MCGNSVIGSHVRWVEFVLHLQKQHGDNKHQSVVETGISSFDWDKKKHTPGHEQKLQEVKLIKQFTNSVKFKVRVPGNNLTTTSESSIGIMLKTKPETFILSFKSNFSPHK